MINCYTISYSAAFCELCKFQYFQPKHENIFNVKHSEYPTVFVCSSRWVLPCVDLFSFYYYYYLFAFVCYFFIYLFTFSLSPFTSLTISFHLLVVFSILCFHNLTVNCLLSYLTQCVFMPFTIKKKKSNYKFLCQVIGCQVFLILLL